MNEKTKRKVTRELVGKAYDRELSEALNVLATQVDRWRAKEIDAFELNDAIHRHHNGISRDLWARYNGHDETILPFVIAEGIIKEDEVPSELLKINRHSIDVLTGKENRS